MTIDAHLAESWRLMCRSLLLLVLCVFATDVIAATGEAHVRLTLKFLKSQSATAATVVFDPESCSECRDLADPQYARDNVRETVVDLSVPRRKARTLRFTAPPGVVRRVVDQVRDLPFRQTGSTIEVDVPAYASDRIGAGRMQTEINEPGLALRIEHADEARRAGPYAEGRFPWVERRAAVNLQFAQREVVLRSGLNRRLAEAKAGQIRILGFDTNYPHGHADDPPHMHMYLRWPGGPGSQVGHYYLDERGLLTTNKLTLIGLPNALHPRFEPGEAQPTTDSRGRLAYTHTITPEGWLLLQLEEDPPCLLRPLETGFDSGTRIQCPDQPDIVITALDDWPGGQLEAVIDGVRHVWTYDRDTGAVLSGRHNPDR